MVHIEAFNSHEEMIEALRERSAHALAGLAPQQANLTWGDHWVQFHDIDNGELIWGRIHLREEVGLGELNSGGEWDEVVETVASTAASLEQGYMYGKAYSRLYPDGELGSTHKAHVWPIEERLFEAAREVGWDHRELTEPAARVLLEIAFRAMRAHVVGRTS